MDGIEKLVELFGEYDAQMITRYLEERKNILSQVAYVCCGDNVDERQRKLILKKGLQTRIIYDIFGIKPVTYLNIVGDELEESIRDITFSQAQLKPKLSLIAIHNTIKNMDYIFSSIYTDALNIKCTFIIDNDGSLSHGAINAFDCINRCTKLPESIAEQNGYSDELAYMSSPTIADTFLPARIIPDRQFSKYAPTSVLENTYKYIKDGIDNLYTVNNFLRFFDVYSLIKKAIENAQKEHRQCNGNLLMDEQQVIDISYYGNLECKKLAKNIFRTILAINDDLDIRNFAQFLYYVEHRMIFHNLKKICKSFNLNFTSIILDELKNVLEDKTINDVEKLTALNKCFKIFMRTTDARFTLCSIYPFLKELDFTVCSNEIISTIFSNFYRVIEKIVYNYKKLNGSLEQFNIKLFADALISLHAKCWLKSQSDGDFEKCFFDNNGFTFEESHIKLNKFVSGIIKDYISDTFKTKKPHSELLNRSGQHLQKIAELSKLFSMIDLRPISNYLEENRLQINEEMGKITESLTANDDYNRYSYNSLLNKIQKEVDLAKANLDDSLDYEVFYLPVETIIQVHDAARQFRYVSREKLLFAKHQFNVFLEFKNCINRHTTKQFVRAILENRGVKNGGQMM